MMPDDCNWPEKVTIFTVRGGKAWKTELQIALFAA
jgi:hypothetical protein